MQERRRDEVLTGPTLRGEQVSELWVWLWSAIDQRAGEARDEAQRLAVAFNRAIDHRTFSHDWPHERFVRDQSPRAAALLAHYLVTRTAHLRARDTEAERRLRVVIGAAALLNSLLRLDDRAWPEHFERLGIGLEKRSVFCPEVREGVAIETLEEGLALPGERASREAQARTIWEANWKLKRDRPRKRRHLEEASP